MRRLVITAVAVLAAAGVLALLVFGVSSQKDNTSIDAQVARHKYPVAPRQTDALPLLGSTTKRDLADYRGKVVVLNVYASWCEPCQSEAPLLASEQKLLARHDATMLGVTYLDNASATETFNRKYGIDYPVLRDVSGEFVNSFGTRGVPETFVINRDGHIQAVRRFPVTRQWLAGTLRPILDARSAGGASASADAGQGSS